MKCLQLALLVSAVQVSSSTPDVTAVLQDEGKLDEHASDDARCWCEKLQDVLAARAREQEFRLRHSEQQRKTLQLDGEQLRRDIGKGEGRIDSHEEALEHMSNRSSQEADLDSKKQLHKNAIKHVQEARDALPTNASEEVRTTLRSLEKRFKEKHEKLRAQNTDAEDARLESMDALHASRSEMLRLEHEITDNHVERLAQGADSVDMLSRKIDAYTAQQQADASMQEEVDQLCSSLSGESSERLRLRQRALLASSQRATAHAHKAWGNAASRIVLSQTRLPDSPRAKLGAQLRGASPKPGCDSDALDLAEGQVRDAQQALDDVSGSSHELTEALGKSGTVQAELRKALKAVVLSSHLFEMSAAQMRHRPVPAMSLHPSPKNGVHEATPAEAIELSAAIGELDQEVKANLGADPAFFDRLHVSDRQRAAADQGLLQTLAAAEQHAAAAVVAANC